MPATTLPENIPREYTHNVSLQTVSKAINTAATNDPSAIASATHTPLCMAGAVSPPSQDSSSRQMSLKRLLAKPAPIFVSPPVGYAGYITGAEDLHDGPRKVLSKSDLRGGWEGTTTSMTTEDGYVRKFRREYEEDTTFGKQDDLIQIFSSGGKYETQVNSSPVTTHDRQTTVQRSNFDNVWEENVLVTRPAGVGGTPTCNTAIEIGPGPGFSSIESSHGNLKGRCVEKLWSPIKDEMFVNNKEKAPKKNVLRRKRSVGERLHNARNFSNTDLPGARQPEDSKRLTSSAVGRHLRDSNEVHMVSVAAADAPAGILYSESLSVPTPAYAPVIGFVHQHPRIHQSCNEPVSFDFNGSRPAVAMYDDVVHSVTDRQSMKKRECKAVGMKLSSASLIEESENMKAQGIIEEQNRWTRLRHADEDNILGGGKIIARRGQRNVSPGNEGRTLSTTARISPFLTRREWDEWDEPQRRVGHHRSDSKQGKVQECVREAVLPWRGAGGGLGEDETLDSSTALQFSKHGDSGYILAVGRSGDSSDDCDYSDSPDASMIQKPSFTKRRKGVMSDHGHAGGSAPDTPERKLEMASWENCKQKGMARAARRSDKRSPKPLNILEKDNLTKGAGKPPGKPNNRKSWWGLMRKFSVSITRDRRIKPSPSMPALSDWSRSTVPSTAPTTFGQPQSPSEYPAAVALERHIVNPSVLEKAYSQEEEKNGSNLQPQVEELLAPLVPPSPNTPREGDWVRSQSPDIELVSLPLPPRKPSKQVSPAERQVHSAHSYASLGENDINCSGSPIIPTFSINKVINAFPSPSRPKTLSYRGLTQADTAVTPSVPMRDPPDSTSPPVASSNPSSVPTPRHLKSSRKSSVKRLPSVDVDGVPPSSTVHDRHRSKSTGAESNRSLSPPTQMTESPSENAHFPLHLAFVRSQLALSASASSAVIRPGTPNTFGSAGVRPGTSESIDSVASEMTIMGRETGRFVSPAIARQLSSPSDAANDGILGAILDAL